MIKLLKVNKGLVRAMLEENGTRVEVIENILKKLTGKTISSGTDLTNTYTLVKVGQQYGIAKRCTYRKRSDTSKPEVGFTLALLRALSLKK